jgi:hypothetical protein
MTFESVKDIGDFISDLVCSKIDRGEVVNMHWAATEVLNQYADINGTDVDFYLICARHYVADQVKKVIKRFEPSQDQTNGQLVLDGFSHMQKAYPVKRASAHELVPTDQLTDHELEARAAEYEKMAAGCIAHADEIRKYIRDRAVAA